MASAHRGARRRAERDTRRGHRRFLHDTYGVQAGWCATEADLPEARRQSHDALIAQMGDRRYGGVQWVWYEGDEANETLDRMTEGADQALAAMYRRIRALLREHGGFLVVAMAPGQAR